MFHPVHVASEQLVLEAIAILADIAEAEKPRPRGAGLRFVLHFLHAHGDGNREPYDRFWRGLAARHDDVRSAHDKRYRRSLELAHVLNCIIEGQGFDAATTLDAIRAPRRAKADRASFVEIFREVQREKHELDIRRRSAHDCPLRD